MLAGRLWGAIGRGPVVGLRHQFEQAGQPGPIGGARREVGLTPGAGRGGRGLDGFREGAGAELCHQGVEPVEQAGHAFVEEGDQRGEQDGKQRARVRRVPGGGGVRGLGARVMHDREYI